MHYRIVSIGVWKDGPERALFEQYRRRMPPGGLELVEIKNQASKALEAEKIRHFLTAPQEFVVALDEHGEAITTRQLATLLEEVELDSKKRCTFLIGGADGLDASLLKSADRSLCLGRMTWPHFLVRGLLVEQLYRVQQIRAGHPYHRD